MNPTDAPPATPTDPSDPASQIPSEASPPASAGASGDDAPPRGAAPLSAAAAAGEELIEPDEALPSISIAELPSKMRAACERAGWTSLTPVQAHSIPYLLDGRDLMVQSRTGSGKTGAFVLPMLDMLDPDDASCQALVLVPTRELCQQVAGEAGRLAGDDGIRIVSVYGGTGYNTQLEAFRKGAHMVVGTPGRVLDHLIRGSLDLRRVKVLVFDEADRMLSMGFYPDMRRIREFLPKRRRGFMFSATYPDLVRRLAGQFLNEPEFLSLSRGGIHVATTDHVFYETDPMDRDRALVRIIEVENPDSAIIFCNTKVAVTYVATVLQRFGYDADMLTADLGQAARDKVMDRLRARRLRFLVATDLAGRGIDVSDLSHVFNYDIPEDPESYIHRTGRTGRAGRTGVAASLVYGPTLAELRRIAKRYGIDLQARPTPAVEDVANVVGERLTSLLEASLRDRDRLRIERMKRLEPLARKLAETDEGISLLAMILDDRYHESLHALPPRLEDEAPAPKPAGRSEPAREGPPREHESDGGPSRRRRRGGGGGRR